MYYIYLWGGPHPEPILPHTYCIIPKLHLQPPKALKTPHHEDTRCRTTPKEGQDRVVHSIITVNTMATWQPRRPEFPVTLH